jgi:hypothetical protein
MIKVSNARTQRRHNVLPIIVVVPFDRNPTRRPEPATGISLHSPYVLIIDENRALFEESGRSMHQNKGARPTTSAHPCHEPGFPFRSIGSLAARLQMGIHPLLADGRLDQSVR